MKAGKRSVGCSPLAVSRCRFVTTWRSKPGARITSASDEVALAAPEAAILLLLLLLLWLGSVSSVPSLIYCNGNRRDPANARQAPITAETKMAFFRRVTDFHSSGKVISAVHRCAGIP